jgi:hypothetical protein
MYSSQGINLLLLLEDQFLLLLDIRGVYLRNIGSLALALILTH